VTAAEWYAQHAPGWVRSRAAREYDEHATKPWVVLAYRRNVRNVRDMAIVAGYNRWSGQEISWIVPSFDDDRYDTSEAVEVT